MSFIRAYLRASTKEQNADRAKQSLIDFAAERGLKIAAYYTENESGATLARPELSRLINDASEGDVILLEQVDRLSRLRADDWERLKATLATKRLRVVALDLPTSWQLIAPGDDFTARMFDALNGMMLDVLAAISRKDYEDRRRRAAQGIEKAKLAGKYLGRSEDTELLDRVEEALLSGLSWLSVIRTVGCSRATVAKVSKRLQPRSGAQPTGAQSVEGVAA